MKKDEKVFFTVLLLILIAFVLISFINIYFIVNENMNIIKVVLALVSFFMLLFSIFTFWNIFKMFKVINNKSISEIDYRAIKIVLKVIYPMLIGISKLFKIDIDSIRRAFININNFLVMTKTIKVNSNQLLLLLPHCLQNSECKYKITSDINNCRMCGKCDIYLILKLCKKYNITAVVATGGTLAREWIKKTNPKAIIAVACERDLASGISDVSMIPVMGVFNQRPNGPCFNTKVDLKKLEESIKFFLKED